MHTRENRREQQSAHAPVVDSVCRCYPYYTYTRSHTYTHTHTTNCPNQLSVYYELGSSECGGARNLMVARLV